MRVVMLGTGGFHPSEERHTACVLIPEVGLLLDAGTAAFRVHDHIDSIAGERLDVVVTHAHLDHVVGLTYLLGLERSGASIETVVHAPAGPLATIRAHLLAPALFPISPVDRFEELGGRLVAPSGAKLTTFPLDHPGGSVGVRIDLDQDGKAKSLAYVTDTRRVTAETIAAIRGVDLLLHEAHFDEANRELAATTGHCTASDAAWAAEEAGVGRLVMVHANPRATAEQLAAATQEAQAIRPEAEYARDEQVIDF